jgi:hypothetical protein
MRGNSWENLLSGAEGVELGAGALGLLLLSFCCDMFFVVDALLTVDVDVDVYLPLFVFLVLLL